MPWLGPFAAALVLFAGLALLLRAQQARALAEAAPMAAPPRPLADVASALATMKLITVEIDTSVTVERSDYAWRGDVSAKLTVPVRLSYGTDLSRLSVTSVAFSPIDDGLYIVRVPAPTRIATEVFSEREQADVQTGGLRLRSRAGEYYLGLARRDAPGAARELVLRPEDAAHVAKVTREQVESLVRSIAGSGARVLVEFDDTPGGTP